MLAATLGAGAVGVIAGVALGTAVLRVAKAFG